MKAWRAVVIHDYPLAESKDRSDRRTLEPRRQQAACQERKANACDTSRPPDPVEDPTKDRGARHPAGEIAGEIDSACRAAFGRRGGADEAGRRRLREEGPDADQDHAGQDHSETRQQEERQPGAG